MAPPEDANTKRRQPESTAAFSIATVLTTLRTASPAGSRSERETPAYAARWRMTSGRNAITAAAAAGVVISTRASSTPAGSGSPHPWRRSSMTRTRLPADASRRMVWRPMNPAPPVTRTRAGAGAGIRPPSPPRSNAELAAAGLAAPASDRRDRGGHRGRAGDGAVRRRSPARRAARWGHADRGGHRRRVDRPVLGSASRPDHRLAGAAAAAGRTPSADSFGGRRAWIGQPSAPAHRRHDWRAPGDGLAVSRPVCRDRPAALAGAGVVRVEHSDVAARHPDPGFGRPGHRSTVVDGRVNPAGLA